MGFWQSVALAAAYFGTIIAVFVLFFVGLGNAVDEIEEEANGDEDP